MYNDKVKEAFANPKNVGFIENADGVGKVGKGMTLDEALNLTNAEVVEELEGLPPQKIHCSVLAEEAIKEAINDYRSKKAENK